MALEILTVDWRQKPNMRERIMFLTVLVVGCLGFFRACWAPSHAAMVELHAEIEKINQEKKVAAKLLPANIPPSKAMTPTRTAGTLDGAGSIRDVQQAIDTVAQPLLLKGVQLAEIKVAELEREGNVVRQKLEMKLLGSFYAVAEYLEAIENLSAPLIIEDFSIDSNDDKSGKVKTMVKGSFYGMDK